MVWTMSVLARPGTPMSRHAPGEHRRQDAVDRFLLAHDALGHLGAEPAHGGHQALERLDVVRRSGLG